MPRPESTLVVVLGAGTFADDEMNCPAFAKSAETLDRYFTSAVGFGAPRENVLFELFDSPLPPAEIVRRIVAFVDERTRILTAALTPPEDLILYYVGHGDRTDDDKLYFLFLKSTSKALKESSGLLFRQVREALESPSAARLRQYLIIDACFAARGGDVFQSSSGTHWPTAFSRELPKHGVSLLCSSSRDRTSMAPEGHNYTMFSDVLLDVLHSGDASCGDHLSLADLKELITTKIVQRYTDKKARLPELISPRTSGGFAVADVQIFPNRVSRTRVAPTPPVQPQPAPRAPGSASDSTYRPPEADLGTLTEGDLLVHLDRLILAPDVRGVPVIFHGLAHGSDSSRQRAFSAMTAAGYEAIADELIAHARCGNDQACGLFMNGLRHCPSTREIVALIGRFVEFIPDWLRNPAEELLEYKSMKLGLEEIRSRFQAAGSKYRIDKPLGPGAITNAYLAWDVELSRSVVIRLLRGRYADDYRIRRGFRELCTAIARFSHENLLHIIGFEEFGAQTACLVRAHSPGETLRRALDNYRKRGKRYSARQAVFILRKVASSLAPLHSAGVPHCGIRPSNIYLWKEYPKVQLGDPSLISRTPSLTAEAIGVEPNRLVEDSRYAAPETVNGAPVLQSDFYSLGCVAYELLTGRAPFTDLDRLGLLVKHAQHAPPAPSTLGSPFGTAGNRVIARLMEKSADKRYRTVAEVKRALNSLLDERDRGSQPPADPLGPPAKPKPPAPGSDSSASVGPDSSASPLPSDLSAAASAIGSFTLAGAQNVFRSLIPAPPPKPPLPPTVHPIESTQNVDPRRPATDFDSTPTQGTLPAPEAPRLDPRIELPGYKILEVVGRGGMGTVYRALDTRLDREVAVKVIMDYPSSELGDRFLAEARTLARVVHPNIIAIYDIGRAVHGTPYITMEYAGGGSLAKRVRGDTMDPDAAVRLMGMISSAVHYIHQLGFIHRDIKPANILLTTDGIPKVSDFGLAKWMDNQNAMLTATGQIVGTPAYMSPEQASGMPVDARVDVYALGATLYTMLTGDPPFGGSGGVMETLLRVREEAVVPPSRRNANVSRDLDFIVLKCLEKEPSRRYATAAEFAHDLERYLRTEPVSARPLGLVSRVWRRIGRWFR